MITGLGQQRRQHGVQDVKEWGSVDAARRFQWVVRLSKSLEELPSEQFFVAGSRPFLIRSKTLSNAIDQSGVLFTAIASALFVARHASDVAHPRHPERSFAQSQSFYRTLFH